MEARKVNASNDWELDIREKRFREVQERYDETANDSFIGSRFGGITLDTLEVTDGNREAILGVSRYVDSVEPFVVPRRAIGLIGPRGTGKTALLVALHKQMGRKMIPALIVSAIEFFAQLKRTFDTKEHNDLIQRLKNAPVLTIDDIGRGPVNQWRNELMMEILDARWRHERPTHFSSNLGSREEIAAFLQDEGIVDRLFCTEESAGKDQPMVAVYRMTGKSWR